MIIRNVFLTFRMIWQGRKECEAKTAICGISVEYQDWRGKGYRGMNFVYSYVLNVAIDGIKLKCCPIGKIYKNK